MFSLFPFVRIFQVLFFSFRLFLSKCTRATSKIYKNNATRWGSNERVEKKEREEREREQQDLVHRATQSHAVQETHQFSNMRATGKERKERKKKKTHAFSWNANNSSSRLSRVMFFFFFFFFLSASSSHFILSRVHCSTYQFGSRWNLKNCLSL